jgi:hypothetical protein
MKLLSPKSFLEYAAEEYMFYVISLYRERKRKTSEKKKKTPKPPKEKKLTFRRTKTGRVSITTKRDPKYVTGSELSTASRELGAPESELFLLLKERGFEFR